MTKDETLRLALEALEAMQMYAEAERKGLRICDETIAAIKKALAQPEREILGNVDYIPCCTDQTCPKCKPPQSEPEPVAFPRQTGDSTWIIDTAFIWRVKHTIDPDTPYDWTPSEEQIETVLLALEKIPSLLYLHPKE